MSRFLWFTVYKYNYAVYKKKIQLIEMVNEFCDKRTQ